MRGWRTGRRNRQACVNTPPHMARQKRSHARSMEKWKSRVSSEWARGLLRLLIPGRQTRVFRRGAV